MSKSIWHRALEIPLFDDTVVFIDDLNNWHTGYTQRDNDGITDHDSGEIYTEENVLRWAYIKDLLTLETKLERTRKALEIAVDTLKSAHEYYQNCVIREKRPQEINWYCTAMNMDNDIFKALEQITALEQKKSEFVHNKIEFPEYNDNLLEEFDKQFFENGQDDDLTETALEQKDE